MTADELRRLAEIAGIEVKYSDFEGCFLYEENYDFFSWQPHLRIEQAMMVAEAKSKLGYTIGIVLWPDGKTVVVIRNKHEHYGSTESSTAEAICRAALAAKEV